MKVLNVSIIKGLTVKESIKASIIEMFNTDSSVNFLDCLEVKGFVGVCVQEIANGITAPYTSTGYFIASDLGGDFVRVEYCSE